VGTGSQTDAARELARELGVSDAEFVSFAERGDLVREYCEADVFVLPSAREVWGLVVNEAMACGVPTVVSNAAGCARDLVLPGVTGFTFDPKSPSELAQVLQDVLADPDQRREMGTEAMKRALLFTPEVYAERIVEAALVAMSSSGGSKKK
jgi:glycosyltransferase involved in cell wall biosynthesis